MNCLIGQGFHVRDSTGDFRERKDGLLRPEMPTGLSECLVQQGFAGKL